MSRNGEAGIIMEQSDGFRISHNRLVRNNDGILPGSDNVITRNHISRVNGGIRIESGHGNLIAHNVVAHTHKAGIHLGHSTTAPPTTSSGTTWSKTAARTGSWSERRAAITC